MLAGKESLCVCRGFGMPATSSMDKNDGGSRGRSCSICRALECPKRPLREMSHEDLKAVRTAAQIEFIVEAQSGQVVTENNRCALLQVFLAKIADFTWCTRCRADVELCTRPVADNGSLRSKSIAPAERDKVLTRFWSRHLKWRVQGRKRQMSDDGELACAMCDRDPRSSTIEKFVHLYRLGSLDITGPALYAREVHGEIVRRCGSRIGWPFFKSLCEKWDQHRVCNPHYNVIQNSEDAVTRRESACYMPNCTRVAELRPVKLPPNPGGRYFNADAVSDGSEYFDWEDRLCTFLEGTKLLSDLRGKRLYSSCLYMISNGTAGRRTRGQAVLPCPAMRGVVTFARSKLLLSSPEVERANGDSSQLAVSSISLSELYSEYRSRCNDQKKDVRDRRTLKSAIVPVLATCGIDFTRGLNGETIFFSGAAIAQRAHAIDSASRSRPAEHCSLTASQEHEMLVQAGSRFEMQCRDFLSSEWSIISQIRAVPTDWWRFTMLSMCSMRQKQRWSASARLLSVDLSDVWPISNACVPDDWVSSLLPGSHRLVVRVLFCFEYKVFCSPSVSKAGPLLLSLSLANSRGLSATDIALSNFLGLSVCRRFIDNLKHALRQKREVSDSGFFSEVVDDCGVVGSVTIQLDNFNASNKHSVRLVGSSAYKGVDACAMQLTVPQPSRPSAVRESGSSESLELRDVKQSLRTRKDFIDKYSESVGSSEISTFTVITLGLFAKFKPRLSSTVRAEQLSTRKMFFSAFRGYTVEQAKIVYASLVMESAASATTIISELAKIYRWYRPGTEGRCRFVVIVVDQQLFKIVFELWYKSIEDRNSCAGDADRSTSANAALDYANWFMPLPGGFHVEKTGIWPLVKYIIGGAGMFDCAPCFGLSPYWAANFQNLQHCRFNRRAVYEWTTASAIRAIDAVLAELPEVAETVHNSLASNDGAADADRKNVRKRLEDRGSSIEVTELVSPGLLDAGEALYDGILSLSQRGSHAKYHLEVLLLQTCIPSLGFHLFTRLGQTKVVDKFWFYFIPLMHSSNKVHYSEAILCHAYVIESLPMAVKAELFDGKPGIYVVKTSATKREHTKVHLDDALESGVIADPKSLKITDPSALADCVAWVRQFEDKRRALVREVAAMGARRASETSDAAVGSDRILLFYDKERKCAANIAALLAEMERVGFLGREDLMVLKIRNTFSGFVVTDDDENKALLAVFDVGRMRAEIHASALFREYGPVSPADLASLGVKRLKRFTLAGVPPTLRILEQKANPTATPRVGRNKRSDGEQIRSARALETLKSFQKLSSVLMDASSPPAMMAAAQTAAKKIDSLSHLQSSRCQSLRKDIDSPLPFKANKSAFFPRLHEKLVENVPFPSSQSLTDSDSPSRGASATLWKEHVPFMYAGRGVPEAFLTNGSYNAVQVDLMNVVYAPLKASAGASTVEASMLRVMEQRLRPYLVGKRASRLLQVHLHLDMQRFMVLEKKTEQSSRMQQRIRSSSSAEVYSSKEQRHELNDELNFPWSDVTTNSVQKEAFCTALLFHGARAALRLNMEHNARYCSSRNDEGCTGPRRHIEIFMHGGSWVVANSCNGAKLQEVDCVRTPELSNAKILLCRKENAVDATIVQDVDAFRDSNQPQPKSAQSQATGDGEALDDASGEAGAPDGSANGIDTDTWFTEELRGASVSAASRDDPTFSSGTWLRAKDYVDSGTCLTVMSKENVLNVGKSGSSSLHCEGETRIIWALRKLVAPNARAGCLIVSEDSDVLAILLLHAQSLRGLGAVHVMSGRAYSLDMFSSLLNDWQIKADAVALAFVFAGCDFVPGTRGVPPSAFAEAFVQACKFERHSSQEQGWYAASLSCSSPTLAYECLTGLAYLKAHGAKLDMSGTRLLDAENFGCEDWPMSVRRWLVGLQKLRCVSSFMALAEDIHLQKLRAVWVHEYWTQALHDSCNCRTVPAFGPSTGRDAECGILYEPLGQVQVREKDLLSIPGKRVCQCKVTKNGTQCASGRCGCRQQIPPVACLFCPCSGNCSNSFASDGQEASSVPPAESSIVEIDDDTDACTVEDISFPETLQGSGFIEDEEGFQTNCAAQAQYVEDLESESSDYSDVAAHDSIEEVFALATFDKFYQTNID